MGAGDNGQWILGDVVVPTTNAKESVGVTEVEAMESTGQEEGEGGVG